MSGAVESPDAKRWREAEELFHKVVNLSEEKRAAELDDVCSANPDLRANVLDLLRANAVVEDKIRAASTSNFTPDGMKRDNADQDRWIGRILGQYRVEEALGSGGMGVVYRANRFKNNPEDQAPSHASVALKLVRHHLWKSPAIQHFLLERDALASLNHKHIARLLDGGVTEEGVPYLVMEYIDGKRLDIMCDQSDVSIPGVVGYVIQLCDALSYVHRNLILHRDLKPGNVLVTADGNVKLLDFGTLKLLGDSNQLSAMTQAGMRPATAAYASPEHLAGSTLTTASDVYSVGVILYRLIAGRLPTAADDVAKAEILPQLQEGKLPPPARFAKKLMSKSMARDLNAIVMKAMRFEPEARYASMDALAADLRRALLLQPVEARGEDSLYRAARFYRRNWKTLWSAAAIVALLVTGSFAMAREAKAARQEKAIADAGVEKERSLAHLLLFDYFVQLQQISGSTNAQKQAVTEAVHYLDGLMATAPSPEIMLESERAYTSMGTLLGSPYYQNLGDAKGGIAALEKALRIADQLVQKEPANPTYLQARALVQMTLGQVYMGEGKPRVALDYLQPSTDTTIALANKPGADEKALIAAITVLGVLGDDYSQRGSGTMHDPEKAIAIYRQVLDLNQRVLQTDKACTRCMRGMALAYTKLGQLSEDRDMRQAVQFYELGIAALDMIPAEAQKKAPVQRSYGTLRLALANSYLFNGRKQDAQKLLDFERARVQTIINSDPTDARARFDLASIDSTAMDTYFSTNDPHAALLSSQRYLDSANRLAALQPDNLTWRFLQANAILYNGKALMETGAIEEGKKKCLRGLDLLLPLAADKDAEPDTLGTASDFLVYLHRDPAKDAPLAVEFARRDIADGGSPSADQLLLLAKAQQFNHQPELAKDAARRALAILESSPDGEGHAQAIVDARKLLAQ